MADFKPDLTRLTPKQMAEAIRHMRHTGVSLYVHGAPGISKSAVSRQVADSLNIAFIDFRLTSVAPEDIRGVPFLDDVGGIKGLIWTPPLVFPRDLDLADTVNVTGSKLVHFYNPIGNNGIHYCKNPEIAVRSLDPSKTTEIVEQTADRFLVTVRDEQGQPSQADILWTVKGKSEAILGLEEFNSAAPNVMAAAYQLVLDRRLGDYVVPSGVMILALGNRRGDKGVTFEIPKPVANRFVHVEMVVKFDDWQEWAVNNDIHVDVIGYLTKWSSHLFEENFAKLPDLSFPTPRSWEFVSKVISTPTSTSVIRALVCGAIGNTVGNQFLSHREYIQDMPDVQMILNGTVKTFSPSQTQFKTQIAYATCVQLCHQLRKETDEIERKYAGKRLELDKSAERKRWEERADRAVGYAVDNFSPEVLVVFNRMALQLYKLRFNTTSMKRFEEFVKLTKDMIL